MANRDDSIILFSKLKRFYNRIKALINLLDERIEETESQVVDTANNIDTLSNNLDIVKEATIGYSSNLFSKFTLVRHAAINGGDTTKRVSSYGDKSFPISKGQAVVLECGDLGDCSCELIITNSDFSKIYNTNLKSEDWEYTSNNTYVIIASVDGYIEINFGKSLGKDDITINEVQALDITVKYAYNNAELTKLQRSNSILLKDNTKKNYLKTDQLDLTSLGVTVKTNDDGSVYVKGTAQNDMRVRLMSGSFTKSNLILSGSTRGGWNNWYIYVSEHSQGSDIQTASLDGEGGIFEMKPNYNVYLIVRAGTTIDRTFYPMLRPADTTPEWVPYIPSNKDLNENVISISSKIEKINKNITGYFEGNVPANSTIELDFSNLETDYSHTREIIIVYGTHFANNMCGEYRAINSFQYGLVEVSHTGLGANWNQARFTIDENNPYKLSFQNILTYTVILYRVHIL